MPRMIYKDALIVRLMSVTHDMTTDRTGRHPISMETIIEYLDAYPTIEAEPVKHGRWVDVALSFVTVKEKCSICGGIVYVHGFNYCPNCGAKMDGGEADAEKSATVPT